MTFDSNILFQYSTNVNIINLFILKDLHTVAYLSSLGWGFIPNIPERKKNSAEPTDLLIRY